MGPSEAVANGFADSVSEDIKPADAQNADTKDRGLMARRQTEAALARAGFTRQARSDMLSEMGVGAAARDAGRQTAARDAGIDAADVQRLLTTMRS